MVCRATGGRHCPIRQGQGFSFPSVDPSLQNHELDLLVAQHESQIMDLKPMAVHIMGEMTFTFRLVSKLKQKGIRCIASTTERDVREDAKGNKISTFRFVQFREY